MGCFAILIHEKPLCHTRSRLLGDLLGRETRAVQLMVDSKSALALAKNPVFHERSKHIRLRHHFIRSCLDEGSITASYINTTDQLADLLTKPLGRIKFLELCSRIGMLQRSRKTQTGRSWRGTRRRLARCLTCRASAPGSPALARLRLHLACARIDLVTNSSGDLLAPLCSG